MLLKTFFLNAIKTHPTSTNPLLKSPAKVFLYNRGIFYDDASNDY